MFNPLRAAAAPPPAMGMVSPCYRGNPPRVGSERLSTPGVEGVDFGASAERACERAKKEAPDCAGTRKKFVGRVFPTAAVLSGSRKGMGTWEEPPPIHMYMYPVPTSLHPANREVFPKED